RSVIFPSRQRNPCIAVPPAASIGTMTSLGALDPSAPFGYGADINDRGWIVGSIDAAGGTAMHGFLWRDGKMTDLGTLGGRFSGATAINDRGQIVGRSETASGEWHA